MSSSFLFLVLSFRGASRDVFVGVQRQKDIFGWNLFVLDSVIPAGSSAGLLFNKKLDQKKNQSNIGNPEEKTTTSKTIIYRKNWVKEQQKRHEIQYDLVETLSWTSFKKKNQEKENKKKPSNRQQVTVTPRGSGTRPWLSGEWVINLTAIKSG